MQQEKVEEVEPGGDSQGPTFEDLLAELPLDDEKKKMVSNLVTGLVTSLNQISQRLETLETQGPAADNADLYAGLSPDQKFQVMMAKASAPAAAAQQGLIQAMVTRAGAGGGGGELAGLLKSAEAIQSLRAIISPEPSTVQVAMEKAQIASVLAQARLVNRVAGKATSDYLEGIEKELLTGAGDEEK